MTLGAHLAGMRARRPLVQNITNFVAMQTMANVLLAAGASPAMVHAREEAAEFAGLASAVTLNTGTPEPDWVAAMEAAATAALARGIPVVLDPVAAGATGYRREINGRLARLSPSIIKGNASEILAVAGRTSASRGADSGDGTDAAEPAAVALARATGGIVAVTGAIDVVTDGRRIARIANGSPLMTQVTALGCALTGIVAAFAAGAPDRFHATVAALAYYALAGERAAAEDPRPGSFATAFLNALHDVTPEQVDALALVEYADAPL
ncbi:hydroxyethylthiazole kinase [Microvirga tunisiensis]|uniref:Hydroxyethylthiazole kinase n=1 Tax=Pannonibacter tanglangensis TaxID=2750084 RepID=A0A7X5F349_9HYPH|nr:hydroxyethylthiazole kinase [Pannonibacter sp. XCT-53]NBN78905.1 hydroxyethylthiazole kinase [Pannonibacter sp. XCT-53]